ncbi:hypothetical protein BDC45DRAFT_552003 [Circinella umbellata]|nr:hypothetical protein BDC45DRAFT_552003 [Circinella umbellata]
MLSYCVPRHVTRAIKVGNHQLEHRVVLAPLTRFRGDENHVPTDLQAKYYAQRATKGGLLITEATFINGREAGGYPCVPGIYNQEQIEGWKKVTSAVHEKGGLIYLQVWHVGRAALRCFLPNNVQPVSASEIRIEGPSMADPSKEHEVPRSLSIDEIAEITQEYAQASKNAVAAGFDGVELHGANGYLIDQFLNTSSNSRTDQYGGSIENRGRFALEVVKAVSDAIGAERVGIRLSPWSEIQGMKDDTPYATWGYLIEQLQQNYSDLAFAIDTVNTLDPFRAVWKGAFISAGGYTTKPELATEIADKTGNLIAIGRAFIANPDLVYRLKNSIPLTKYNRDTFYTPGPVGYTDYPFAEQEEAKA